MSGSLYLLVPALLLSSGARFHEETSARASGHLPEPHAAAAVGTEQPKSAAVELPPPPSMDTSLGVVLKTRRSKRRLSGDSLSVEEVSALLWAADGVSAQSPFGPLRTAPSAGALYPLELYCFVERVSGLATGLYRYDPQEHALEPVRWGSHRDRLPVCAFGQVSLERAPVVIAATAVFERCCSRYGDRGYRYVYQEAGHVSQNLYLAATALNLGTVVIGAFYDDALNRLLGIDGAEEAVLWLHPVGRTTR
jgi:SagB-type dehydrogenase family enzyme